MKEDKQVIKCWKELVKAVDQWAQCKHKVQMELYTQHGRKMEMSPSQWRWGRLSGWISPLAYNVRDMPFLEVSMFLLTTIINHVGIVLETIYERHVSGVDQLWEEVEGSKEQRVEW